MRPIHHHLRHGLLAFAAVAAVLSLPTTASADVAFDGPTNYAVGAVPDSVATGDFNGDGNADLVVANSGDNTVSVRLGDGTGSFGDASSYAVGDAPDSIAVEDLNGDGIPDLAVANETSQSVSVLLGDGTGGFEPAADVAVNGDAAAVASADFNGDGVPDLAVAEEDQNQVGVLLGDGSGSFGDEADFAAGAFPVALTVGDLDNDGNSDLAVANWVGGSVSVLLGDGAGGFGEATDFDVGTNPSSVSVTDLNGDGNPDLVAARAADQIAVLLGDGTGTFGEASNFYTGVDFPEAAAVGDFNGDGNPDVAVAMRDSGFAAILPGDGTGGLGAAQDFNAGTRPKAVAVADFNDDGADDVAVANKGSDDVSVLLQTAPPETPPPLVADLQVTPHRALTGDTVNFDASGSSGDIADYQWDLNGDGTFETDTGTDPTAFRAYSHPGEVDVAVQITDADGNSDETSVPVGVLPAPPGGTPGVRIDDGDRYTNHRQVTLSLIWPRYAANATVADDSAFTDAETFPVKRHEPWTLPSSLQDGQSATVYVGFDHGLGRTHSDDIVLDQTNPVVQSARLAVATQHTYALHIDATDSTSGVRRMQVTRDTANPGKWRRFRTDSSFANHGPDVFVRVRDGARNPSRWVQAH